MTARKMLVAGYSKARRDKLRALGKCICGPADGTVGREGVEHGPVVAGGRCQRCWDAKRRVTSSAPRPSSITCPQCRAKPRQPCRAPDGHTFASFHQVRRDAVAQGVSK